MSTSMHILVIGGTGFIGYHIVNKLIANQDTVTLLSRHPERAAAIYGDLVHYQKGDLSCLNDIKFEQLFTHIDTIIYAAGVDERQTPKGDAYTFFYQENVATCIQLLEKAKQYGVTKALVLGSIFSHINEQYPELTLTEHHPYIRSRTEQKQQCLALANAHFQVNVIEIPFVFGHTPGQNSLWKTLYNYIRLATPLIVTPGGANVISVVSLAQAIVGVAQYIHYSGGIVIGDENLTWEQLLTKISRIINNTKKPITVLQKDLFSDLTRMGAFFQAFIGISSGLDHKHISKLINLEAFIDTTEIKKTLHYKGGDINQAFLDTAKGCPANLLVDNLQKSINWMNDSTRQTIKHFNKINTHKK